MATVKECYGSIMLKRIHESEFPCEKVSLTSGKDNQKFPIHIVVLTAASKYFTASLGPNFKDGEKDEFILEGSDSSTVKAIVDYCYTGQIHLTEENVGKFLAIASSVQLDLLEAECRRFYEDKLGVTNCVDALLVADRYNYADMRQKAFDFICATIGELPSVEIQKLDHRLVEEVLKCDQVQAAEELVFKQLLEWFHYNEIDRKPYMPDLLKLIRLEHISQKFLNDTLEIVYRKFDCSELVFVEYKRRLSTQCSNIGVRRNVSTFCLFTQIKGENGAEQSAIKIEKFNPVLNSFDEAGEVILGDRKGFGVALRKNKIFVLGGRVNNEYLKSASAFDLNTGEEEILAEMNSARAYFVPIFHGKHIYVFGGFNGSNRTQSCERFDTETKSWTIIKEMNFARDQHSVTLVLLNECICVAGGYSNNKKTNTVELYDPIKDEWTQFASICTPRVDFTTIKSNESLYAIGDDPVIERYDPWKNRWMEVGSFKDSERITSTINIDGDIFGIMSSGVFGRITIEENGAISFVQLATSEYKSEYRRRHFLCRS